MRNIGVCCFHIFWEKNFSFTALSFIPKTFVSGEQSNEVLRFSRIFEWEFSGCGLVENNLFEPLDSDYKIFDWLGVDCLVQTI